MKKKAREQRIAQLQNYMSAYFQKTRVDNFDTDLKLFWQDVLPDLRCMKAVGLPRSRHSSRRFRLHKKLEVLRSH